MTVLVLQKGGISLNQSPRIGIIGLGGIGHHHTTQLAGLDATLGGGVDVNPDARTTYTDEYDVSTYPDLPALLDNHTLDGVIVTTLNKFHEPASITALNAGISVLCEKPLAHTLESARKTAHAAHQSDAFFMAGFNNRFDPTTEAVIDYRDTGNLGTITHIEANFVRRRGIPGRGSWFTQDAIAGGGSLIDIGVHVLDLALYLYDYPDVKEVTGVTRSQFGHRTDYTCETMWGDDHGLEHFDVDDSVTAMLRLSGHKTVTFNVAWATNRDSCHDIVVEGTDAGARYAFENNEVTYYETDRANSTLDTRTEMVADAVSHQREQKAFLTALRTGEAPTRNTIDQALTVQRIVNAIYISSETGRSIDFTTQYGMHETSGTNRSQTADD